VGLYFFTYILPSLQTNLMPIHYTLAMKRKIYSLIRKMLDSVNIIIDEEMESIEAFYKQYT